MAGDRAREYWDHVAQKLEGKYYLNELLGEHKRNIHLKLVERWGQSRQHGKILKTDLFEEALGTDDLLFHLRDGASQAMGVDVSPRIVERAKARAQASQGGSNCFVVADVRALPFASGSFDLIISNSTLDHFPVEADLKRGLSEISRALLSGGILIITMDNPSNPLVRLWRWLTHYLLEKAGLSPFYLGVTYTRRQLCDELERVGLQVTDSTAVQHLPFHWSAPLAWAVSTAGSARLEQHLLRLLETFEKLGHWKTRYLTGHYVAVKAVKPLP